MPHIQTPDLFWLTAQEVLDCVCEALDEETQCECPCRKCVVLGPPVWDDCCEGQLTVYLERVYIQNNFPASQTGAIQCAAPIAGDYTVQLLRCVPVVDDNGNAPSCEAISDSSQRIYSEMYVAFRAVLCCLAAYKKKREFSIRDVRPVGPRGGCAGFEIKFSVQLIDPIPLI